MKYHAEGAMLPREVLRQIRLLQVRARRAVEGLLGGEYHSVFRGTGISFEEVREYQPGDDIRAIDWNVTARMGHPFVKRYVEERELTVLLVLDGSGSLRVGSGAHSKRETAVELAAVLAFSAIANNDKVGLIVFTDRVERFLAPRKGSRHVLRLIRELLFFRPEAATTSVRAGLEYLQRLQRRRAIVFLFSDFLDADYDQVFKQAARRHDLLAVRVWDRSEEELPAVGFLEVEDAETAQHFLLDTGRRAVRDAYATQAAARRETLRRLVQGCGADLLEVTGDGKHLEALAHLFRLREQRMKRGGG